MKNKIKKTIGILFLIIAIALFIILIYGIIKAYINGYEIDISSPVEIEPKRYGLEAIQLYLYFIFSFRWFGIISIPIYSIAFLYILIYIQKSRKNKKQEENENKIQN